MKKLLILLLLIQIAAYAHAQNIVDIFYRIPEAYVDDLKLEERQELIKTSSLQKNDLDYHIDFDTQNGYLKMEFSYTEGQSGFGIYELTYWNLSHGKLIALSVKNGSHAGYFQSDLKFFTLKNNEISVLLDPVFEGYSSDFETTMLQIIDSFLSSDLTLEEKQRMIKDEFTIDLPQKGTDICIQFSQEALERHGNKLLKSKQWYFFDRKSGTFQDY